MEATLSTRRHRGGAETPKGPVLFLAMHGYAPLTPPSRHVLRGVSEITIARGPAGKVTRQGDRLDFAVPDPWMSSSQTRITPMMHRWLIEDLGSRNGTFLSGGRIGSAPLSDGDLIEVGRTFFVFRDNVELADDVLDLDGAGLDAQPDGMATLQAALAARFRTIEYVAHTDEPVLIVGETGTGKELLCRAVHELSGRTGDFVAVNCGALPETMVEASLFGHAKGAFSGAVGDRRGFFRAADGGTLVLDEIGDLRMSSQAALLRVLQEGQVVPLGEESPVDLDVRVCSATHQPLDEMIAEGRFRDDLLARLSGFTFELPPLRERREDIGLLVRSILSTSYSAYADPTFSSSGARALFSYDWPKNIRQLARALGSALALAREEPVSDEHLPAPVREALAHCGPDPSRSPLTEQDFDQRAQLVKLLRRHEGNIAAVARETGKGRQQIHRWLKRFDIRIDDFRK